MPSEPASCQCSRSAVAASCGQTVVRPGWHGAESGFGRAPWHSRGRALPKQMGSVYLKASNDSLLPPGDAFSPSARAMHPAILSYPTDGNASSSYCSRSKPCSTLRLSDGLPGTSLRPPPPSRPGRRRSGSASARRQRGLAQQGLQESTALELELLLPRSYLRGGGGQGRHPLGYRAEACRAGWPQSRSQLAAAGRGGSEAAAVPEAAMRSEAARPPRGDSSLRGGAGQPHASTDPRPPPPGTART
jgi:hypothetical protein